MAARTCSHGNEEKNCAAALEGQSRLMFMIKRENDSGPNGPSSDESLDVGRKMKYRWQAPVPDWLWWWDGKEKGGREENKELHHELREPLHATYRLTGRKERS